MQVGAVTSDNLVGGRQRRKVKGGVSSVITSSEGSNIIITDVQMENHHTQSALTLPLKFSPNCVSNS